MFAIRRGTLLFQAGRRWLPRRLYEVVMAQI